MPTYSKVQSGQSIAGFFARSNAGLRGRYAIERELGGVGTPLVFLAVGPAAQMPRQETSDT